VLQAGGARRPRSTGPGWRHALVFGVLAIVLGLAALLAFMAPKAAEPVRAVAPAGPVGHPVRHVPARTGYGIELAPPGERVQVRFKQPLRSGLLFDVRTGRVLWRRDPGAVLPIASLTKMMTALVVTAHTKPSAKVLITKEALGYSGSGVGLLPLNKRISLETMLYGLMLPSGNDAAIALAQHVAKIQGRFVRMMNDQARAMGLSCTRFASPSGIVDQGNHSCASDLAVLAHSVLEQPLLARIVATDRIAEPFPVKGGKLYLFNNNPLFRMRFRGTDGVKTGYTVAAGRCLVASARRGRTWLGVVLLHSNDPPDQAIELLNAGFARLHA
jgi:D-alanyl-D-alanine carboxypeptidase